jgi:hypothetical protein
MERLYFLFGCTGRRVSCCARMGGRAVGAGWEWSGSVPLIFLEWDGSGSEENIP